MSHRSVSGHFGGEFVQLYSEVVKPVDKVSSEGLIKDILWKFLVNASIHICLLR